ncbi:MAG: hypothetical protein R6W89_11845, partial [Candidatus Hydrogenedentota bacterium]
LPPGLQGVIVGHVRRGSGTSLAHIRAGVVLLGFGEPLLTRIEHFKEGRRASGQRKGLTKAPCLAAEGY